MNRDSRAHTGYCALRVRKSPENLLLCGHRHRLIRKAVECAKETIWPDDDSWGEVQVRLFNGVEGTKKNRPVRRFRLVVQKNGDQKLFRVRDDEISEPEEEAS